MPSSPDIANNPYEAGDRSAGRDDPHIANDPMTPPGSRGDVDGDDEQDAGRNNIQPVEVSA
jgi:hypothetical protein